MGKAHKKFAKKLHEQLSGVGIRSELNDSNETVGYKIRSCEKRKLPYMLVIGDKEVKGKTLNVRLRGLKAIKKMTVKSFMSRVLKEIEEKK